MAAVCHSKHVSGCENNNTDLSLVFNIYFIRIIFHGLTTPARCSSGWIVETLQGGNGTVAISSAASSTHTRQIQTQTWTALMGGKFRIESEQV